MRLESLHVGLPIHGNLTPKTKNTNIPIKNETNQPQTDLKYIPQQIFFTGSVISHFRRAEVLPQEREVLNQEAELNELTNLIDKMHLDRDTNLYRWRNITSDIFLIARNTPQLSEQITDLMLTDKRGIYGNGIECEYGYYTLAETLKHNPELVNRISNECINSPDINSPYDDIKVPFIDLLYQIIQTDPTKANNIFNVLTKENQGIYDPSPSYQANRSAYKTLAEIGIHNHNYATRIKNLLQQIDFF